MKCLTPMLAVAVVIGTATGSSAEDGSQLRTPGRLQTAQVQPTSPGAPPPLYIGPSGSFPPAPAYSAPHGPIAPTPIPQSDPAFGPIESYSPGAFVPEAGIPLYHNVRYKDLKKVHPCAVPKIVMVPDPCGYGCVPVEICVPPCACERVKVSKKGKKITYDYGKYEVEIRVKKDYIEVDYDGKSRLLAFLFGG